MIRRLACAVLVLGLAGCASSDEAEDRPVEKIQRELPVYRAQLEKARGANLTHEVPVARQTDAEFRARLKEESDRDLPEAKAQAVSRSLARMGLLPPGYDLRQEAVDNFAVTAAAYYDPHAKKFFLLKPAGSDAELRLTIVHELDHALQDQRFDLEKLAARVASEEDDDRMNALKFLVEGEATYVGTLAVVEAQGIPAELCDMLLASEAALSRQQQDALTAGKGGGARDAARAKARKMPLYVYRTLVEPYMRGAALVSYVRRWGGWEAVDRLWKRPPASTEQCLHPEKLIAGEEPVRLTLPDLGAALGADATPLSEGTLGELGVDCLVRERLGPGHDEVAPGWAGDRYRTYARGARTSAVWFTTWDTEQDAREFEVAAVELAKLDAKTVAADETSLASRRGQDVVVLLGVPKASAARTADQLFAGIKRGR